MSAGISAAPDVVVRHCTVDVVRRGGWSWGPDRDLLTGRVLDALSALIDRELAGSLESHEHVEITEPVVLDIRLRLSELLAGRPGQVTLRTGAGARPGPARIVAGTTDPTQGPEPEWGNASPPIPGLVADPHAEPEPAWRWPASPVSGFVAELAARQELAALVGLLPEASRARLANSLTVVVGPTDPDGVLAALLPDLARRGELAALLGQLPTATLATWRELWTESVRRTRASGATTTDLPDAAVTEVSAALGAAIARGGTDGPAHETSPRDVRPQSGTGQAVPGMRAALAVGDLGKPDLDGPAVAPSPAQWAGTVLLVGDRGAVELESVLPFLLTGPLARLGILDALLPALAMTGTPDWAQLTAGSQLFAAALGCTVLGPLRRGWQRAPADRAAAAAFAGLDELPDEALGALVRAGTAGADVLDAVVALALCRGHSPRVPLLLAEVSEGCGGGLVLADPEGLFPIGWTDEEDLVLRHWTACGRPLVLLGAPSGPDPVLGPVSRERLPRLVAAGMRFATDLPPTRRERWHRLPGRRRWVSPGTDPGPGLVRSLCRLPDRLSRLDELIRALAVERRAAPLVPIAGLARTLPLVAALGLGTVGWSLWKEREPADPLLALERFADLSGVVRYGPDDVSVRVPLGRRHADLLRSGLLADVRDVPWLHGRTLTITGG